MEWTEFTLKSTVGLLKITFGQAFTNREHKISRGAVALTERKTKNPIIIFCALFTEIGKRRGLDNKEGRDKK